MRKSLPYSGEVYIPSPLPHTEDLPVDVELLYFGRLWWGGANTDAAVWWRDDRGNCWRKCIQTGNNALPLPRIELVKEIIQCKDFDLLLEECLKIGILQIADQPERASSINFDDIVSIRLANGTQNTYAIRGAKANDERHSAIRRLVRKASPEFDPRYLARILDEV